MALEEVQYIRKIYPNEVSKIQNMIIFEKDLSCV